MRIFLKFWTIFILLSLCAMPVGAQDNTPAIPIGLSDPYLMFVPVGWRAETPDPFGFVRVEGDGITLNMLDPVRLLRYVPYTGESSPRQLLVDYWQIFYAQTISRATIALGVAGDNTYAVYRNADAPQQATYSIQLADGTFALVDAVTNAGNFDAIHDREVVAILATISRSPNAPQTLIPSYTRVVLPSGAYSLSLPENWRVEPSLTPGELFLVGDGFEVIFFPPDSLAGYFDFPPDVPLRDLATVIEREFFQTDLASTQITSGRAGTWRIVTYGLRNIVRRVDSQVLMVGLPEGGAGYFRAMAPADGFERAELDLLNAVALSLKPHTVDAIDDPFEDELGLQIIPLSGQWQVEVRELMRFVCDGTVETLIPLTDEARGLFAPFDTILARPEGDSLTTDFDGIVNLLQTGSLERNDSSDYARTQGNVTYVLRPVSETVMQGRLNIIDERSGVACRTSIHLDLRYVE